MNGKDILLCLSLRHNGDWEKIMEGIRSHETVGEEEAKSAEKSVSCSYVTILDGNYPESFRHCYRPPLVLFYYGNFSLLSDEGSCIAYIGSRDATPYGLKMARTLAGDLANKGYVIVSGLARGIDAEATRAALDAHGHAIGILGCGIEVCYPSSSHDLYERLKKDGLLLSEYPLKVSPTPENFPQRNRLVASSSKGIIVGEASKKSGTLITVAYALGLTKEIGCVPYPADCGSACNALIKEGASMIENASDVDLMMGRLVKEEAKS